jgi:hypothetical protein
VDEQLVAGEVIVESPRTEKSSDTASTTGETSSAPGESSHRASEVFWEPSSLAAAAWTRSRPVEVRSRDDVADRGIVVGV